MRGDRLISLLMLLQTYGRMTAKELAKQLEVSERTIYRDMDALSGMGVPVVVERGKNGGCSLLEGFQSDLTGLTETEIQALLISPSSRVLGDLGWAQISDAARYKIMASIPSIFREQAKDIWNRIHIDTSSWRKHKESIHSFEILKNSIWQQQKLELVYQHADGHEDHMIVSPLGLVAKGERWYLVAAKEHGELRNYRVSRILQATPLEQKFARPKGFNLPEYWQSSVQAFVERLPSFIVDVESRQEIISRLTYTGRYARILEIGQLREDGWIPVRISFDTEEEAVSYILGFSDKIKVIEPVNLISQIYEAAKRTIDLVQSQMKKQPK